MKQNVHLTTAMNEQRHTIAFSFAFLSKPNPSCYDSNDIMSICPLPSMLVNIFLVSTKYNEPNAVCVTHTHKQFLEQSK